MSDINSITIGGRLTGDPIVRDGGNVAVLPIANNRQRQVGGEWITEVCYIDATVFSHAAKRCIERLVKGDPVIVNGRLELNTWEAADGTPKRVHRVIVQTVNSEAFGNRYVRTATDSAPLGETGTPAAERELVPTGAEPSFNGSDDDIPF